MDNTVEQSIILEVPEKKKRGRKKKSEILVTDSVIPKIVVEVPKKKKNYLNNADLMKELAKSKVQDKMTDELAKMLTMLCDKYAKHPDYMSIYSYVDDMKAFAMMTLVKVWRGFNAEKTNNPFAYFTQILRHAFYQYLNSESRQRTIKDEILINSGEVPSFNYMENYRDSGQEHDMGSEVLTKNAKDDDSDGGPGNSTYDDDTSED